MHQKSKIETENENLQLGYLKTVILFIDNEIKFSLQLCPDGGKRPSSLVHRVSHQFLHD